MIDCHTYRRALLADPGYSTAEAEAHRSACEGCARFHRELTGFEARLARAVRLPVASATVTVLRPRRPVRIALRGRFALAASVLLGVGVAAFLWLGAPQSSLADDLVGHMANETDSWRQTDQAVPQQKLAAVLGSDHMHLMPAAGTVSYVSSCSFRGHQVPHFVVQEPGGPVTVMALTHEQVSRTLSFDEHGYRGVIIPVPGHGALAVLTQDSVRDTAAVERIAARVVAAIAWDSAG